MEGRSWYQLRELKGEYHAKFTWQLFGNFRSRINCRPDRQRDMKLSSNESLISPLFLFTLRYCTNHL